MMFSHRSLTKGAKKVTSQTPELKKLVVQFFFSCTSLLFIMKYSKRSNCSYCLKCWIFLGGTSGYVAHICFSCVFLLLIMIWLSQFSRYHFFLRHSLTFGDSNNSTWLEKRDFKLSWCFLFWFININYIMRNND